MINDGCENFFQAHMGIEDLNLDLQEHADHVLLITESAVAKRSITRLLDLRSYRWSHAPSRFKGSDAARHQLFDAVIFDTGSADLSPLTVLENLQNDTFLGRSPIIVLHPNPEPFKEELASLEQRRASVLKSPVDATEFLVRLTTVLRLRKMRKDEIRLDMKIAEQNAQLRDLTNRFKSELKEAQSIQQSILPESLPSDPRCNIAACYIPLEAVGGDLYDVFKVGESTIGVFIGDVTGHGLPAAFIGAMTKMALAYADKESPEEMFREMNDGIADLMPPGRFVTVAAGLYDTATGNIKIARGGHPPPFIWRKESGEVEQVLPKGMALGMLAGVRFELYQTQMHPGDRLLLHTDGIMETTDMNNEMIGIEGTIELFKKWTHLPIQENLDKILEEQDAFAGGRILKDDNTLIGLECVRLGEKDAE